MSFGGIPASRHLSALRRAPSITNLTFRLRHNGQHIGSAATETGCVWRPRSAHLPIEIRSSPDRYILQTSLELDRLSALPRKVVVAPRFVGLDRRHERPQVILGVGASTREAGLPSRGLFCVRIFSGHAVMKFGIDRLIAEPALRAPLAGRRVALLAHPASVTED